MPPLTQAFCFPQHPILATTCEVGTVTMDAHFTDVETEALTGKVTWPKSHRGEVSLDLNAGQYDTAPQYLYCQRTGQGPETEKEERDETRRQTQSPGYGETEREL